MSYRIGIDVGGTFTDFLLLNPEGQASIYKVMTVPDDPSEGLIEGLTNMARDRDMTLSEFASAIDIIVHGTTVATNAVLTGTGCLTGLVTTAGFRDALQMRRGIRERQYDNKYMAPEPLVDRYLRCTVQERVDYRGNVLAELNKDDVRAAVAHFEREGVEAIAVCLLHAHATAEHEEIVADMLGQLLPDAYLSISSELWPQIRFYDRTSTTVLNAYVGPLVQGYMERLTSRLHEVGFHGLLLIMQSNGGISTPEATAKVAAGTLLSGPAAGPVAGLAYVEPHGSGNCITVDMGGTSFDAALIVDKNPPTITDGRIRGHLLALPMLDINTIGAGGGSIGWIDASGLLRMGPQSAGATPGPACYGRGGARPTITDADLLLGYLNPDYFLGGKLKLYPELASSAVEKHIARPLEMNVLEAAAGMFAVINNNMADGIREISVERGFDPRDFPLVVAGGAGPIHAAVIAEELEIPMLVVPRASSIFCAVGMLLSDLKHHFVRSCPALLEEVDHIALAAIVDEMADSARELLTDERISPHRQRLRFSIDLRSLGQFHEINVPLTIDSGSDIDRQAVAARFFAIHNQLYGYSTPETPIEVVSIRLEAIGVTEKPRLQKQAEQGSVERSVAAGSRRAYLPATGSFEEVDVYDGDKLVHGHHISGPALIEQVTTTIFVPTAYDVTCDPLGSFVLTRKDRPTGSAEHILGAVLSSI